MHLGAISCNSATVIALFEFNEDATPNKSVAFLTVAKRFCSDIIKPPSFKIKQMLKLKRGGIND